MRTQWFIITLLIVAGLTGPVAIGVQSTERPKAGPEPQFTADFGLEDENVILPGKGNKYFSLRRNHFLRLEGMDDGEHIVVEITVLHDIVPVIFEINGEVVIALTRVVEEREWVDGELVEVSRNYFASQRRNDSVFYFGEDVDIYEDGKIVGHEGAWLAGENGALPGLIMPDVFLLGSRYFQETAPGVALDRAEHVEMGVTVQTPAGEFHDCIVVSETTPLDPNEESVKIYAPYIGLIQDDTIQLVDFH